MRQIQKGEVAPLLNFPEEPEQLFYEDIPRVIATSEWTAEAKRRNSERSFHDKVFRLGRVTMEDIMIEDAVQMDAEHEIAQHQADERTFFSLAA